MKTLLKPVFAYVRELWTGWLGGWDQFWFKPTDPTVLAFTRICTGLILSYIYLTCLGEVQNFVGPNGWMDEQAVHEIRNLEGLSKLWPGGSMPESVRPFHRWYFLSAYVFVQDLGLPPSATPLVIELLYAFFLVGMICLTLGVFSRTAAVVSWIGHLSFVQRGYLTWFGMDSVLAMLTLYLMLGPSGAVWSFDNFFRRYERGRRLLGDRAPLPRGEPPTPSWTANFALRLMQIHMCIIYFCAGCAKLQGSLWWNGTAVWYTMMIPEFRLVDSSWLALIPWMPWLPMLISNVSVALTILFEVGFPFFIYVRILRPLVLFVAVALHAGIGLFMGLGAFGCAMLTGVASFLNPVSLRWFFSVLLKGQTGFRFVYDRHDATQRSLAAWLYAADAWEQLEFVPAGTAGAGAPAGSLIAPDGPVLQGLSAFRRLFWSIRTLWVLWPFVLWQFATIRSESLSPLTGKR